MAQFRAMAALCAVLVLKLRLAAALAVCQSERLPVGYRRLKSSNDVLMPHLKTGAVGVAMGAGVKFDVDISIVPVSLCLEGRLC